MKFSDWLVIAVATLFVIPALAKLIGSPFWALSIWIWFVVAVVSVKRSRAR